MPMKWLAAFFALFILAIIVLADTGRLPHAVRAVYDFPYGDKVGHFVLYGILTLLLDLTLLRSLPPLGAKRIVVLSGLALALIIGLEEFSQQFFSNRTFDLIDLTASYLGVGFFSWLSLRMKNRD